ncbi:MAG: alpha/beta fold hydrolase [Gammaproteobacteria bacterium]|nr:alpha/beta fold hydrolase [Gammaproteobacteria bacterium]MCP5137267.1 alpha/beta fold hydrolase [Gammaproteobacteria bacterium]
MRSSKVRFPGAAGHTLVGVMDMPDEGEPAAYAVFAHCFTCSKNIRATAHISRALTAEGIGVLRFDFTGLGESEGNFSDTNFSTNLEDLAAAADFLTQNYDAPKLMIGHSLGGTAAIVAAHKVPSCIAVVTIASPYEPEHVVHHFGHKREEIEANGEAEVKIVGRPFTIRKQFLDDVKDRPMEDLIGSLGRALLIFHGPLDDTVDLENAGRIFQAAKHPKSFISLDRADHLLSDTRDSFYVGSVISAWVHRYLRELDEE